MKINCGPTRYEIKQAQQEWHRWFAWHPVRIDYTRECRWLEYVERRVDWFFGTAISREYRLPTDSNEVQT